MVERVVVTAATRETLTALVYWADKSDPTRIEAYLARYAHRLIAELRERGLGTADIARRLYELELQTSRGKAWTPATVWQVQHYRGRKPVDRTTRVPQWA